jgi:hypothetical protein
VNHESEGHSLEHDTRCKWQQGKELSAMGVSRMGLDSAKTNQVLRRKGNGHKDLMKTSVSEFSRKACAKIGIKVR